MKRLFLLLWHFNLLALYWNQDLDDLNDGYGFLSTKPLKSYGFGMRQELALFHFPYDPRNVGKPRGELTMTAVPKWIEKFNFRFLDFRMGKYVYFRPTEWPTSGG